MPRYFNSADALHTLKKLAYETALNQTDIRVADVFEDIAKNRIETWVDLIPTADVVERKKGKWLDDGLDGIGAMGIEYRWQKCSCCGNSISKAPMQRFPSFCSNCGADMREESDNG